MSKNALIMPGEVHDAAVTLGRQLRTARLRRNFKLEDVASRIGVHRVTVSRLEKGDPTVSVGVLITALWVYGLLPDLVLIANPLNDRVGIALEASASRQRAKTGTGGMDDDF
jgi:transcriptional regulator with XRE-family HTH domain